MESKNALENAGREITHQHMCSYKCIYFLPSFLSLHKLWGLAVAYVEWKGRQDNRMAHSGFKSC